MPGRITELAALTGGVAATTDLIEAVDISDTSMAATGTNKKMSLSDLATFVVTNGGNPSTVANRVCILNLTAGQSIPQDSLVAINWTSERADAEGWHAPNSSDITVPAGTYMIGVQVAWDVVLPGTRFHHLEVDEGGVTRVIAALAIDPTTAFGDTTGNMTVSYVAAATATFRVKVYQTHTAPILFGSVSGVITNRPLASANTSGNVEFTVLQTNGVGAGGGGGEPVGTKMTALVALTGAGAAGTDIIEVVDISDTTMAASGTNKKITLAELIEWLGSNGLLSTTDGGTVGGGLVLSGLLDVSGSSTFRSNVQVNSPNKVTVAVAPTAGNDLTNKTYVDGKASGGGAFFGFNFDSATAAGPVSAGLRLNNATPGSATIVYISYTSKDGVDLKTRLLAGTAGDRLYIQERANSANYRIYSVTGTPTDSTTYATVAVTHVSGSGTFGNGVEIVAGFLEPQPSSDTVAGLIELATAAEVIAGTDAVRAVTPLGAAAAYVPRLTSALINAQTGTTYTIALADNQKLVTLSNAGAITLSIPTNAVTPFPIGSQVDLAQLGAGKVTVAAVTPGTTTVNATPSLGFRAQYSGATITKLATDTWLLIGDLA